MDQWVACTLSREYYQMPFQLHIISCLVAKQHHFQNHPTQKVSSGIVCLQFRKKHSTNVIPCYLYMYVSVRACVCVYVSVCWLVSFCAEVKVNSFLPHDCPCQVVRNH